MKAYQCTEQIYEWKKCLQIWKHNSLKKIKHGLLRFILKKIKCCLTMINYKTNWNKIQKNVFVFYINLLIGLLQPNKKKWQYGEKIKINDNKSYQIT